MQFGLLPFTSGPEVVALTRSTLWDRLADNAGAALIQQSLQYANLILFSTQVFILVARFSRFLALPQYKTKIVFLAPNVISGIGFNYNNIMIDFGNCKYCCYLRGLLFLIIAQTMFLTLAPRSILVSGTPF